jgi:putative DNA methylase
MMTIQRFNDDKKPGDCELPHAKPSTKVLLSPIVNSSLPFESIRTSTGTVATRAIEDDAFPFESFSDICEAESWRKEINRPLSHIHKWWAQRLGSAFRAILIGALSPSGSDTLSEFYSPVRFPTAVVFDPFMGSGTTVIEALKMGVRVIGRDINPVAHFLVSNAVRKHRREEIDAAYREISSDVSERLKRFYKAKIGDIEVDVLYYFWVKFIECPHCNNNVDLFASRIFSRNAYPKRIPEAKAVCPSCGEVNEVHFESIEHTCEHCRSRYNPQIGAARGQQATCTHCLTQFRIVDEVRKTDLPPAERMFAKLVMLPDGAKQYARVSDDDFRLYEEAARELSALRNAYPVVEIKSGFNTKQALGYNYRYWHQMFNQRQLLCLSLLAQRISSIRDRGTRELFTCLFSGALEFNNMFASYKGEGTGAVRHMFAHHILKPERTPLEANLWGTSKSSGAFSTMFEGRIRRALDYADSPFELSLSGKRKSAEKAFGLSRSIGFDIATDEGDFDEGRAVYLSCGDSSATDLKDRSVDAVVTDPPFFDNVHYSELADFFFVWQQHIEGLATAAFSARRTTRSDREVQSPNVEVFTQNLGKVFREANRVLRDDGILAFTYHHSRTDGWSSVLEALSRASFVISAVQPIKAEMSVAMPKNQAKEPIDLDVVIVCRKRDNNLLLPWVDVADLQRVVTQSRSQVERFVRAGRRLSRNDVRVIVMAQLLKRLSALPALEEGLQVLRDNLPAVEASIQSAYDDFTVVPEEN